MKDASKTVYASSRNSSKVEYISTQNTTSADWYRAIVDYDSAHYTDYIEENRTTEYKSTIVQDQNGLILNPSGNENVTFSVLAKTGDVNILKGHIGNFIVDNNLQLIITVFPVVQLIVLELKKIILLK